jgi:hypothetical protein
METFELGMSKDNVSFDFLKKQDKYFPGYIVLDMKKYGQMRFVKNYPKRGKGNIRDIVPRVSGDG